MTQAETGASTDAALPATPHQEEVIAGSQEGGGLLTQANRRGRRRSIAPSGAGARREADRRG